MEGVKIGDPFEADTGIGPLVAERQRDRVEDYVQIGKDEDATLVTGGGLPSGLETGWYVEPTLFSDITSDMRIAREEIFGPVLTLIPLDTLDEAVAIANDTDYGLSGAVYAADENLAEEIASVMRAGQVSINSVDHKSSAAVWRLQAVRTRSLGRGRGFC